MRAQASLSETTKNKIDVSTLTDEELLSIRDSVQNAVERLTVIDSSVQQAASSHRFMQNHLNLDVAIDWVQPVSVETTYNFGSLVVHKGSIWQSNTPFNSSEPGAVQGLWDNLGTPRKDYKEKGLFDIIDTNDLDKMRGAKEFFPALRVKDIVYDLRYINTFELFTMYHSDMLVLFKECYFKCLISYENPDALLIYQPIPFNNTDYWEYLGSNRDIVQLPFK